MKKHLISTSAIALGVAMAAPVAAQEWDVGVGGYMRQHMAYRDISGSAIDSSDFDGMKFHSKSQIHFSPSITLDNGLTFGATVKLQTENKNPNGFGVGQQIDESYMTISGDTLGQIIIGSTNSAGYKLMTGAPGVNSVGINSPSISTFIPFSAAYPTFFRQAGISTWTEVAGNNDVQRLTYFTPSFNGLTLGVSYAGQADIVTSAGYAQNTYGNPKETLHDIFDIGVNYSQTFGTTSVELSARYGTANRGNLVKTALPNSSNPETWGLGAQVGFGDFLVGASYTENNAGFSGPGSSSGWSLGASYDMAGPWSFGVETYQGETKNINNRTAKYEAYQVGATRDLGPGVSWDIYVSHIKADTGASGVYAGAAPFDPNAAFDADDWKKENVKGTIIGTGINISF